MNTKTGTFTKSIKIQPLYVKNVDVLEVPKVVISENCRNWGEKNAKASGVFERKVQTFVLYFSRLIFKVIIQSSQPDSNFLFHHAHAALENEH